jgi:hypothetical protein
MRLKTVFRRCAVLSALLALVSCQMLDPNARARLIERDLSHARYMDERVVERDLTRPRAIAVARPENVLVPIALERAQPMRAAPQESRAQPVRLLAAEPAKSGVLVKALDSPQPMAQTKAVAASYIVPFAPRAEALGPTGNQALDQMAKDLTSAGAITLRGRARPGEDGDLQLAQYLALRRAWLVGLNLKRRGVYPKHWRYYYSGKKNKDAVEVEAQ